MSTDFNTSPAPNLFALPSLSLGMLDCLLELLKWIASEQSNMKGAKSNGHDQHIREQVPFVSHLALLLQRAFSRSAA